MAPLRYEENVFINCPFDPEYRSLLTGLVFAVHDCGFVARCALEIQDSSQIRIDKIFEIIAACQFGIHDISRTELDPKEKLPRFNMPLELGMFLGAKRYGSGKQRNKRALILDREKYRYQQYCSDIAGQDIQAHHGDPKQAIRVVRNWLGSTAVVSGVVLPSGSKIAERYEVFQQDLPAYCAKLHLDPDELIFNDLATLVAEWLKVNAR